MNLLWIGRPTQQLQDRIPWNQYYISHTFEIFRCGLNAPVHNIWEISYMQMTDINCQYSRQELVSSLPYFIDLWSRWDIGSELNWQQLTQQSADIVSCLTVILSELKIDQVIACYAIPHHIWNNLVELACEKLKMPVLHLYPYLELNISLPVFGNNHNLGPFPQSSFDSKWSSYTSSTIYTYIDRLKSISFSQESKNCFKRRFKAPAYIHYCRSLRLLKSMVRDKILRLPPYIPLSYAGLKHNPLNNRLCLQNIQHNQKLAISFYLRNLSKLSDDVYINQSTTFLLIGHVQPEASTAPMGGSFSSQIEVAKYLRSKCRNCRILYKEHPGSLYTIIPGGAESLVGVSRSVEYYKNLLSLGVEFLSPEGNVISILKEHPRVIPVTITGSVAIEAPISIASPCIYFGEPYWSGYPGSIHYQRVDWSNIDNQFCAIRSRPDSLQQESIKWLTERASLNCLPNIAGYGISSRQIHFSDDFVDLFFSRLIHIIST